MSRVRSGDFLSTIPDEVLAEAFRGGCERAWALLLARYSSFIYSTACFYARLTDGMGASDAPEDTASGLYLHMAQRLRESIPYYRGECSFKTWVHRLMGDRRQVVKTFLMRTECGRHRTDTRLPRVIQRRSALDQEVYRRLVWGKSATQIAWDLGIPESRASALYHELLELLRAQSPRVYRRIMANRLSLQPALLLDRPIKDADGKDYAVELADPRPSPEAVTEHQCLLEHFPRVRRVIERALSCIAEEDLRLLILLFDYGWSLAQVVNRAKQMGLEELDARHRVDYRLTKILRYIAAELCQHWNGTPSVAQRDEVVLALKALFRERGVRTYLPELFSSTSPGVYPVAECAL